MQNTRVHASSLDPTFVPLQFCDFNLHGLETFESAISFYNQAATIPISKRRWTGDTETKRKAQGCAFSRFQSGAYAEYQRRVFEMGSEVQALDSMERELQSMKPTKLHSALQKLCSSYMAEKVKVAH